MVGEKIVLQDPGIRMRLGWDVWDAKGKYLFSTMSGAAIWRRRSMGYFRDNTTRRVFAVESRDKTIALPPGSIEWR